jgi:hypothetical protein
MIYSSEGLAAAFVLGVLLCDVVMSGCVRERVAQQQLVAVVAAGHNSKQTCSRCTCSATIGDAVHSIMASSCVSRCCCHLAEL